MVYLLIFLLTLLVIFFTNIYMSIIPDLPAIKHLTPDEVSEIDWIDLADGDFTGQDGATVQDRINLADLEFDDDEIILFLGGFPWQKTLDFDPFSAATASNIWLFTVTLFETAAAAEVLPNDIMICQAGFRWRVSAVATGPGYLGLMEINIQPLTPVPIFSHFYLHNQVALRGAAGDALTNWRFYFIRKKVPKALAQFIRFLRMQDL